MRVMRTGIVKKLMKKPKQKVSRRQTARTSQTITKEEPAAHMMTSHAGLDRLWAVVRGPVRAEVDFRDCSNRSWGFWADRVPVQAVRRPQGRRLCHRLRHPQSSDSRASRRLFSTKPPT